MPAEGHKYTSAALADVWSWGCAQEPAWLISRRLIGYTLMLEQHVIFESNIPQTTKDGGAHEMMRV